MKGAVLISVGLVWLAAVVWFFFFAPNLFGGVGIDLPIPAGGLLGRVCLALVVLTAAFIVLGWLIPISIGLRRVFKRS